MNNRLRIVVVVDRPDGAKPTVKPTPGSIARVAKALTTYDYDLYHPSCTAEWLATEMLQAEGRQPYAMDASDFWIALREAGEESLLNPPTG